MAGTLMRGTVGILPVGALGVSFFFHLTRRAGEPGRVLFLERKGSSSAAEMRERGELRIASGGNVQVIPLEGIWLPDLLECSLRGSLPEVILICTQSDQQLSVIQDFVDLLVSLSARGSIDEATEGLPYLVLCSNGIYFQRVRQFLVEKLEEATLFGRLPDLWPDAMPRIVAKLLRGVSIQTGQREGSGPSAVYRPGPSGRTRLAGGGKEARQRCASLLAELGGWFDLAGDVSPTRVEFEKALVNLGVNLLGQLAAIDEEGHFQLLKIREILSREGRDEAKMLAKQVVAVGRAVNAFRADESFEPLYAEMMRSSEDLMEHIPSSLQWIELQLRHDRLGARLSPTESWLLEPLIRYAHAAGLEDSARYFENLIQRVEAKLALAAKHKKKGGTG